MTDKEVSNLASSMNALTKQMEKMSAQQLIQSKNIDGQKKDFEDILKNSKGLENSYKEQGNLLQKTTKYIGEIGTNLKNSLSSTLKLGSTISTIGTTMFAANIIKDMVDLDNKMTALSVRMGKGHKGIEELKSSVTDLQEEFGTSYENASMLIEELAKDKYIGNIKDAAAGIDLFSRATDVSRSAVLELTNNLSKSGGLGTDAINSIYASMLKTQQSVGISDKGMNALVETINDMTMNMVAFGKTDKEIKQMAVETTALVGAFEKVGVSAARTTQLVNQLTDPDRIEDNILLYSQLGVSMEDALSGSIDIGSLDGQFKEMADRIVQMGPIAGSQFAKSMGLSYKEVSRMAEVEAGAAEDQIEKALTPEEQALEAMKSLEQATEGIGKQFETGLNKIEGKLKKLPGILLIGAALILPLLVKKGKELFHKIIDKDDIQSSIEDSIVPAVKNSSVEASKIIEDQTSKISSNIVAPYIENITKTATEHSKKVAEMAAKGLGNNLEGQATNVSEAMTETVEASTEALEASLEENLEALEGETINFTESVTNAAASSAEELSDSVVGAQKAISDAAQTGIEEVGTSANKIQASVVDAIVPSVENSVKKVGGIVKGQATKLSNTIEGHIGQWFDSTKIGGFFHGLDRRVDASLARLNKESFIDKFLGATRQNLIDETSAKIEQLGSQSKRIYSGLSDALGKYQLNIKDLDFKNIESLRDLMGDKVTDKTERKAMTALFESYIQVNDQIEVYENKKKRVMTKEHALNEVRKKAIELDERQKSLNEEIANFAEEQAKNKADLVDLDLEIAELEQKKKEAEAAGNPALRDAIDEKINLLNEEAKALEANQKAWEDRQNTINGKQAKIDTEKGENEEAKNQAEGMVEKHKNAWGKLREGIGNKIKSSFGETTLGKNLEAAKSASKREHLGFWRTTGVVAKTAGVGMLKGAGNAGLKALGGIAKGVKGMVKNFGPMALVASILGRLLEKIKEPLSAMIDQVVDSLSPVIEKLLPPIKTLMDVVVKELLPPVLQILGGLLTVANFILNWTLIPILKLLGHIPGLKGAMDGICDVLDEATGPEVSGALFDAAGDLKENGFSMQKSSEDMADSADKIANTENEPLTIKADGANFYSDGYSSPSEQASERMTSTSTYSANTEKNNSSEDALTKAKNEKRENEKNTSLSEINKKLDILDSMYKQQREFYGPWLLGSNIESLWGAKPKISSIENMES